MVGMPLGVSLFIQKSCKREFHHFCLERSIPYSYEYLCIEIGMATSHIPFPQPFAGKVPGFPRSHPFYRSHQLFRNDDGEYLYRPFRNLPAYGVICGFLFGKNIAGSERLAEFGIQPNPASNGEVVSSISLPYKQ